MTPKRTVVVVAAVAVGVVAAVLSYYFLNNAQNRAYNNAKLVPAYVVNKAIPAGLTGAEAVDGNYFQQKNIPAEIRPGTAITNLAGINGELAVAPFSVGQVLVQGMFVSPAQATGAFSQRIPAGQVAVTVSVDAIHGVANLPVPGDHVDLLVDNGGNETFLLQNVPILAIGQSTANSSPSAVQTANGTTATTTPNTSGLFTFAATPSNAQRIAFAEQNQLAIYLLLVPSGNPVVSVPPSNGANILAGPQT
jgi:Flp pilus assembly protein CpaB